MHDALNFIYTESKGSQNELIADSKPTGVTLKELCQNKRKYLSFPIFSVFCSTQTNSTDGVCLKPVLSSKIVVYKSENDRVWTQYGC